MATRKVAGSMLWLAACLVFAFTSEPQTLGRTTSALYLLPRNGGVSVGSQLQLHVVRVPRTGVAITRENVSTVTSGVKWKSSDTSIAIVSSAGRITGVMSGAAVITATVTSLVGRPVTTLRTTVRVGEHVHQLRGPSRSSVATHCEVRLHVDPVDANLQPVLNRPVDWRSADPEIAFVRPSSLATIDAPAGGDVAARANELIYRTTAIVVGKAEGRTVITASTEGVTKSIEIVVTNGDPTSVQIYPEDIVLDVQEAGHALAVARNASGCVVRDAGVSWQTADASIVRVTPTTGDLLGMRAGTTDLTATTNNGVTGLRSVTVPAVDHISLAPGSSFELDIGSERTITAAPLSSDEAPLQNRTVTWTASSSSVSISSTQGYSTTVTGVSVGDVTVTARSEGKSAAVTVSVPRVQSITIAPPSCTVDINSSRSLTATLRSPLGSTLNNRSVTWRVDNANATVSPPTGYSTRVTGRSAGEATVTASSEGVSRAVPVHVANYCEQHLCATYWRVENWAAQAFDLYEIECSATSCTGLEFVIRVPAGYSYNSGALIENNVYVIGAVGAGCDPSVLNCLKMETAPFIGGPGVPAVFGLY